MMIATDTYIVLTMCPALFQTLPCINSSMAVMRVPLVYKSSFNSNVTSLGLWPSERLTQPRVSPRVPLPLSECPCPQSSDHTLGSRDHYKRLEE